MNSKHSSPKKPAEQVVKDIRRTTRRHLDQDRAGRPARRHCRIKAAQRIPCMKVRGRQLILFSGKRLSSLANYSLIEFFNGIGAKQKD